MSNSFFKSAIVISILLSAVFHTVAQNSNGLKLWYDKPATQWVQALPLGNGKIGAMVFGGIEEELIQLNEAPFTVVAL